MERFSCEIHVRTAGEQIHILGPCQPDVQTDEHEAKIIISAHQVDLVVKWLTDARDELLKQA